MNKKELQEKIEALETELKPLKQALRELWITESINAEDKVARCEQGKDKFTLEELTFSALARCGCGAGIAYPKNIGIHGAWYCSAILLGEAKPGTTHNSPLPFAMYEIKSENQPSAGGVTTRPQTVNE
jgi:hypothetical protein